MLFLRRVQMALLVFAAGAAMCGRADAASAAMKLCGRNLGVILSRVCSEYNSPAWDVPTGKSTLHDIVILHITTYIFPYIYVIPLPVITSDCYQISSTAVHRMQSSLLYVSSSYWNSVNQQVILL